MIERLNKFLLRAVVMMNYSETKDFESSDQPILIGEVWDTNYWALILLGLCVAVVFGNVLVSIENVIL